MPANTRVLHIISSSYPLRGFLDLATFVLTRNARSTVMYKGIMITRLATQATYPKHAFVD
ncbi:hypothetical protein MGWOODY_Clf1414 [hydrothermal vent metagenome]|uniref:Uncharacterized protein n=1 Tax=hydrothermal vent metagenome TaxID=652676 RepID=A0A161KG42_9ZZZZ